MLKKTLFHGMETFLVIWAGQLVSLLGSAMTRFALLIWAYEQTHEATTLALLAFCSAASSLLAGPLVGMVVDRFNRRLVMLAADTGSGLVTIALLGLYASGHLQIWHLFFAEGISGFLENFQLTAYLTATTLIVPRDQYSRAAGLRAMARSVGRVIAPFAAGALLPFIHIDGVMTIDVVTFLAALGTLLAVRVPMPAPSAGIERHSNPLKGLRFGLKYIQERPGLALLTGLLAPMSLFSTITYFGTMPAMLLARKGGGEMALGTVQSVLGIGALAGSLLVSTWGGPRRKIHGVLAGAALSFLLGDLVFAFGQSLPVWIAAAFCAEIFIPFIIAGENAIWQTKVPAGVQGTVLAANGFIRDLAGMIGYLIAGPLADGLMNPAMMPGGALAPVFGPLVGVGPGAGIAVMFIFTGTFGVLCGVGGYLMPQLAHIEEAMPDAEHYAGEVTGPAMESVPAEGA